MPYTYHELKVKTVQELRDIAKDIPHDAVQGYSQMNKDHLLPALCKALGNRNARAPGRRGDRQGGNQGTDARAAEETRRRDRGP